MSPTEIAFEQFCLFPKERLVLKSGRPIQIGSRAFDILSVLLDHPGLVVPKQELIARVWPNTTLDEANLTVHMTNLRRALATSGATDRLIVNVPGSADGKCRSENQAIKLSRTEIGVDWTCRGA